ncbi:MAG: hypothetical protein IJ272_07480 [Clostridia bacterium]|nr:hypothetical protein [Clostridia bacterium]
MNIKPEFHHNYKNLTRAEVMDAHTSGRTITGFVEGVIENRNALKVHIGQELYAQLPFSEVTIYPLRYNSRNKSELPTNIRCLLHRKVRVKVTVVTSTYIEVSRKKNMEEALEEIKKCEKLPMYVTQVIDRSAFGDIGEGICGKLFINEVSQCHIHKVGEYISAGQTIDVVILEPDNEQRVNVSYKQSFKPYCKEDYYIGMNICCKVGDWIQVADTSSYYVNIAPQVSGIMTINEHKHIKYGSDVECVVTGVGEKGLFLKFTKLL